MPKPASFEMSADTRLLRQRLAKVKIGESITYATLSAEISKTVSGATPCLHSARASLLRDDRIVFSVIRGEGLKRLSDAEIVAGSSEDVTAIRRRAKKAARKITSVADYNALSNPDQLRHTASLSVFTAIAEMASEKGLKRVENAAQGRSTELPISQTLQAFTAA